MSSALPRASSLEHKGLPLRSDRKTERLRGRPLCSCHSLSRICPTMCCNVRFACGFAASLHVPIRSHRPAWHRAPVCCCRCRWNASLNQNLLHPDVAPVARDVEAQAIDWLAPHFGMGGGHMTPGKPRRPPILRSGQSAAKPKRMACVRNQRCFQSGAGGRQQLKASAHWLLHIGCAFGRLDGRQPDCALGSPRAQGGAQPKR